MTHIGLKISPETSDLTVEGGHLALVEGTEAVGQHASQRIKAHAGEWFLDTRVGIPWISEIMAKSYDPDLTEALVKAEILDTDGVTEITSFSIKFDQITRGVISDGVRVRTIYDEEVQL